MNMEFIDDNLARWLKPALIEEDADRLDYYRAVAVSAEGDMLGHELIAVLAAHGRLGPEARNWLAGHLAKQDDTFVTDGRDELLRRLAAVAVATAVSGRSDGVAALAGLAARSAAFAGLDAVIQELPSIADRRVAQMGRNVRSRVTAMAEPLSVTVGKQPTVKKPAEGEAVDPTQVAAAVTAQAQVIKKLIGALDEALPAAAGRQRSLDEEVEMLWWVIRESDESGKPWASQSGVERAVAAAAELAARTLVLPGPPSAGHLLRRLLANEATENATIADLAVEASKQGLAFGDCDAHVLLPVASCVRLRSEFGTATDEETWQNAVQNKLDVDPKRAASLAEGSEQVYRELQIARLLAQ